MIKNKKTLMTHFMISSGTEPDLFTFGRSDYSKHTIQNNKDLTPDFGGQIIPDRNGRCH
jgi:hypothetical protein